MHDRTASAHSRRDVLVTAGLLALLAAGIAAARGYTYHEPLERDITLYSEIGRELLAGRALYADLWDHKPPGIHVAYALAQVAVGPGLPAVYLLAVGAAWIGLLAVYAAGRAGGGRGAGLLAAGVWAFVCGDLGLQANQPNTEVFINAWAAIGFALILAAPARERVDGVRFVAVGAAFAAASLFKPVILAVAAGLALAHVQRPPAGVADRRYRLAEIGVAAVVGAGAWALVTTYFALTDRLPDFASAMWTYNRFHAGDVFSNLLVALRPQFLLPRALHFALPLLALVGVGLCWEATRGASRHWRLYAGYAAGVFVAVAAPGKFFPHYYQLWLPLLAIGPAWILSALWRTHRTPAVALGAAVLVLVAWHVLPQYSLSLEEWSRRKYGDEIAIETHDLARQIDALLPEGETLFHWGNDSGFYFTSGRRPSTGILFVKPLVMGPLTADLSRRTLAQLRRDPPAFLVARTRWLDKTPLDHPVLAWLLSRYVPFEGDLESENFAFYSLVAIDERIARPGRNDDPSLARRPPVRTGPPNIVFILIDDMGWHDASFTGHPFHETPNIDRLAAEGLSFTDAYASAPNCLPSRASLMTGLFTPGHRMYTAGGRSKGSPADRMLETEVYPTTLPPHFVSLAEAIKAAGYVSASIGKWHLGEDPERGPLAQGFDVNVGGFAHMSNRYFSPYSNPAMKDGPEGEYITDRLTNEAIEFIETNRSVPFFLYLSLRAIHRPMTPEPHLEKKYQLKRASDPARFGLHDPALAAALEAADSGIGRILATLDELELSEDTVVFFTSDNGAAKRSEEGPLRGTKGMLFEGGIRVPLLVRWPAIVRASATTEIPVSLVDIYPTLVEVSGAPERQGQEPDGLSLLPVFEGRPFDRERPIFWHFPLYLGGGSDDAIYPWHPRRMRATPASAVRMGDWKLLHFAEGDHVELYNLRSDIGERHDLAAVHASRTRAMLHQLEAWRRASKAFVPGQLNPDYVRKAREPVQSR